MTEPEKKEDEVYTYPSGFKVGDYFEIRSEPAIYTGDIPIRKGEYGVVIDPPRDCPIDAVMVEMENNAGQGLVDASSLRRTKKGVTRMEDGELINMRFRVTQVENQLRIRERDETIDSLLTRLLDEKLSNRKTINEAMAKEIMLSFAHWLNERFSFTTDVGSMVDQYYPVVKDRL